MDGILLVDKPAGPTSHDIVQKARRILGTDQIGHAGTLDPPATGLLVLAVGRALKILQYMEEHDKEYEFTVRFGRVTDTDDATGRTLRESDPSAVTREQVEGLLDRFRGEIRQIPPQFAAIKKDGKKMVDSARRGEHVEVPPRTLRIHELELRGWNPPCAGFRMACSKGTYVRALARDLGEACGVGASVETLRRTASGPFQICDASSLEAPDLLPPDSGIFHLGEARLSSEQGQKFTNGRPVERKGSEGLVRVYIGPRFVGIGESDGAEIRPRKVLA